MLELYEASSFPISQPSSYHASFSRTFSIPLRTTINQPTNILTFLALQVTYARTFRVVSTMSEFRDMSMINLYSTLGYEKKTSRRKFEELDAAAQSFYREYTAHGNVISTSRVDTDGARLCALSFLEEDNRGEKFWPHNSEGVLTWTFESDRDRYVFCLTCMTNLSPRCANASQNR